MTGVPLKVSDLLPDLLARALTRLTTEPGSSAHLETIFETASKPCPGKIAKYSIELDSGLR